MDAETVESTVLTSGYLYMVISAFVSWALTTYVGTIIPDEWRKQLPKFASGLALALTSGLVVTVKTLAGQPLTMDVLLFGLGAGSLAVVGQLFPEFAQGRLVSNTNANPRWSEVSG